MPPRLIFTHVTVFILAAGLLASSAHAQITAGDSKKAAHQGASKKAVPVAAWTPDPKLVATLGPEQQFGAFAMRIPAGYKPVESDQPEQKWHATSRAFTGPPGTNGLPSTLLVFIGHMPVGSHVPSADELMDGTIINPPVIGMVKSGRQKGTSNHLQFIRQYFDYRPMIRLNGVFRGFSYATSSGQDYAFVEVIVIEHNPADKAVISDNLHSENSFALLEAATLTLRKTP